MHQLAIAFKNLGVSVVGYDLKKSKYTKLCEQNGISVFHKFSKELCNVDICVKTGAIKNNKITKFLNMQKTPILDRAEILGWICGKFKQVIAVAGTHGKSTTSALIYHILRCANKKVSCHIGAEIENARFEFGDDFLVVEACEYNKSFLKLKPDITVITNVEREHMECYKTIFNLKNAFISFLKKGKKRFVYSSNNTKFLNGINDVNFVENTNLEINPKLKGEYNLQNISLATSVCLSLGIDDETIIKAVNSFNGIARRYELIGERNNSKIYVDYAHHPTEVKAFIKTFMDENINTQIIFQPHTYSRTKNFIREFISLFKNIENLVIYREYGARENASNGLSAKQLYYEIKKVNPLVKYCNNVRNLNKILKTNCSIAFVGAGDINLIAGQIVH